VGTLPYGQRKRVELGRALALEPALILLDEPTVGMNLEEKEDMVRFILDVSEERRTTIVLVEHDMDIVMDISDRIIVFDFGVKIAEGPPAEIKKDDRVIRAYLGEG
jgi:branched-chain amino acid transport system ATP-binding protein